MARFTIDLPTDLGCEGTDAVERTGADAVARTGTAPPDVDASVWAFVSWVECWAGA